MEGSMSTLQLPQLNPALLTDKELVRYCEHYHPNSLPIEWQMQLVERLNHWMDPGLRHTKIEKEKEERMKQLNLEYERVGT